MTYKLRAVIGKEALLRRSLGERRIMSLPQDLALVPIKAGDANDTVGLFHALSDSLRQRLVAMSAVGPVAYVEAEFFGGRGTQSAIAWKDGSVLFGPRHTQTHDGEDDRYTTSDDLAINQALRALGVSSDGSRDEFDALGLGDCRDTSE